MRNYKRKTQRGSTSEDVLKRAEAEVKKGSKVRSVAKEFNIDRMTLSRFIKKRKGNPNVITGYKAVAKKQAVLTQEMEKDLADHIKLLADMFHGLSLEKCCKLAYELAVSNSIKMPSNWEENKKAGVDWWLGFKVRHHLAIRCPEATSFARATAFNRPIINQFYDNLASVMDRNHFRAEDIYNLDETGCTTVQTPKQVVTEQGKKQVGAITSGERGELVTVVYTISASGNVLPPMFIFPRVNFKDHFIKGSPTGSIGRATRSGWINEDLFLDYMRHVIPHTRCSPEHKVLIIMDNHESHISVRTIDLAKENGVVLLTIPPHTSHRLQPLDRTVYGPFKTSYNRAIDGWLRSNPGKTITIYEIPELVNEAHLSAFNPRNIISGFKSTGIYPYNRDLFGETDFAPAAPTDRALEINPNAEMPCNTTVPVGTNQTQSLDAVPSTSGISGQTQSSTETEESMDDGDGPSGYVSPAQLLPLPKAGPKKANRPGGRKKGKTTILTDTPVRNEIAERSRSSSGKPKKAKSSDVKKVLFSKPKASSRETSSSSESDSDIELDDDTDSEASYDAEIIEGDFVIVKVTGKSRTLHYILVARVDSVDDGEYEGIFLQKVPGKVGSEDTAFVLNENDEAAFPKEDIIRKLPQPKLAGGSLRRRCQFVFPSYLPLTKYGI